MTTTTAAGETYAFAINELHQAAEGHPSGFPFSPLAETALVRVLTDADHEPDTREHLLAAAAWLEQELGRHPEPPRTPAPEPKRNSGRVQRPGGRSSPGSISAKRPSATRTR